ncbi:MAG: hypothetical protein U0Q03_00250 [Acidimicrobiales bacterium]
MAKAVNEDGQVWAVPVGPFGFCPAVVARRSEPSDPVGFSLVFVRPVPSADLPDVDALPPLDAWGAAVVALVSRRPFSTKRWALVGSQARFRRDEWPMPPWRGAAVTSEADEGWSVATTGEAPSMTVIANDPVRREEAERFPPWHVVTAPSALEKAITNHLKGSTGGFWDSVVEPVDVDTSVVSRWRDYGAEVRARPDAREPEAWPAGTRTDRALSGGEWLAFPAAGGGFGVGLFLPRPPSHLRTFSDGLVFVFGQVWSVWPTLAEARELAVDDVVALAQTSMICVRDGRWRVLGRDDLFNTDGWPLPTWWTPSASGDASIDISTTNGMLNIPLNQAVIDADPKAGSCWRGSSSSYSTLEAFPGRRYATDYMLEWHGVTPTRVKTWREVNRCIEAHIGRPARSLWASD